MTKQTVGIAGMLLLLCSCSGRKAENAQTKNVLIDTVCIYGKQQTLQFPGRVKAGQEVNQAFKVSGTLLRLAAAEGSFVRKGTLLAELDARDYRIQAEATEAEYKRVKAEAERVMALYDDKVATPDAYDKARYGLQQITAKYENSKNQLADTRIYAPFDGYVLKHLFDPATVVGAGMPVISLVSAGAPEIEINIPGSAYVQRSDFKGYEAAFDVWPDKVIPLTLLSISPKANANQLYTVRLAIPSGLHPEPTPGMNAMVTVKIRPTTGTRVSLPASALFTEGGDSNVWIFNPADSTVSRRQVQVERLHTDGDAIVTSGLEGGQTVVTSGVHQLHEGDKTAPLPRPSQTNVGGLL